MDEREAKIVIIAADQAHGGCSHCRGSVIDELIERIPEVPWTTLVLDYDDKYWDPGFSKEKWLNEVRS